MLFTLADLHLSNNELLGSAFLQIINSLQVAHGIPNSANHNRTSIRRDVVRTYLVWQCVWSHDSCFCVEDVTSLR